MSATATAAVAAPAPRVSRSVDIHEYFARQRTGTADLPDPAPLLRNLALGVLESLAGVREVDQLARWLNEETFLSIVRRVNLAARARSARGTAAARPHQRVVSVRYSHPADGVTEAVVIVETPNRTRAIPMRLEGIDRRWRATSLALL